MKEREAIISRQCRLAQFQACKDGSQKPIIPRAWFSQAALFVAGIVLSICVSSLLFADDPAGLATNDFGNNGEESVPDSAYEAGKNEREDGEYIKQTPNANQREYYEKGGKTSNHDGKLRARIAYKAARYQGPKNGYNETPSPSPTPDDPDHTDGPRPMAGGGKFADEMPTKPEEIITNIYKFVEDIMYPKGFPSKYDNDEEIGKLIEDGTIDIGKPFDTGMFNCIETNLLFASLVRELGFPVRDMNVLPSFMDGAYDTQTAATYVRYGGKWNFFDPWESHKDSKKYLEGKGHAGYGGYHDVDIWTRTTSVNLAPFLSEYMSGKSGRLTYPHGWKKIYRHWRDGTSIKTEFFSLRLEVQDSLGNRTGGVSGPPAEQIDQSLYVPYDYPFRQEHGDEGEPDPYGKEIITLLYEEGEPTNFYEYTLLIYNQSGNPESLAVELEALPSTVDIQVDPMQVVGTIQPGETQTLPFYVTIGALLELPPMAVSDLYVANQYNSTAVLEWFPVGEVAEYRIYSSQDYFEETSAPGVDFIGSTTDLKYEVTVPVALVFGVEAIGLNGLPSGLDPAGGSTTFATNESAVPALSPLGMVILVLGTAILAIIVLCTRGTARARGGDSC